MPRRKACSNGYSVSTTSPGKGSFSNLLSYSEQLAMGRRAGITFPNYYAVAGEDDHIFGLFLMSFTSLSNIQLPIYFSQVFCAMPETKQWKPFNKRYTPNKVFFWSFTSPSHIPGISMFFMAFWAYLPSDHLTIRALLSLISFPSSSRRILHLIVFSTWFKTQMP